ncbi:hypothetical protein MSKOL_1930 [Methanosarcina sp. Kolksee]|nr:hypothetical protein MSKOL_1930 [Methanosarcina sp. Kolksee]
MIHYLQGNYEEAVKKYNQSLKMKEELGNKSGIAITLGQMGRVLEEKGEYELALKDYYTALEIFEELKSPNRELVRKWIAGLEGKREKRSLKTIIGKIWGKR